MKTLVFLWIFFFAALGGSAQQAPCPKGKQLIYEHAPWTLCGTVLDSSGFEKLISKFRLSTSDSLLIDEMHNEGASFLLQASRRHLVITAIDLEIKEGKYKFPEMFSRRVIHLVNGKTVIYQSTVRAAPLVAHLKKDFKKTTELY